VPKGTAPEENLFYPNPQGTVPGSNEDMLRSHGKESTQTTASSTLGGATSADVNKGMGKPAVGQSSAEMRHEGHSHRKKEHAGIEGSGAGTSKSGMKRAEKIGEPARKTEGSANAEDRVPESAERM
jgi:F-box/leucine-rich repeat protein 7